MFGRYVLSAYDESGNWLEIAPDGGRMTGEKWDNLTLTEVAEAINVTREGWLIDFDDESQQRREVAWLEVIHRGGWREISVTPHGQRYASRQRHIKGDKILSIKNIS